MNNIVVAHGVVICIFCQRNASNHAKFCIHSPKSEQDRRHEAVKKAAIRNARANIDW